MDDQEPFIATSNTPLPVLQAILYEALGAKIGLLLRTNDPERARAKLYAARAKLGDPELAGLQIRMSPLAEGDLVITKGINRVLAPTLLEELDL